MSELLKVLVQATLLREADLRRLIAKAPRRYKEYTIPKKSGGLRDIAQPSAALKYIQRAFVDKYLAHLPVHDSATAYRAGRSIRDNALPHAGHGQLLKMDFKEFFPSIKARDWRSYCNEHGLLQSGGDIYLSEKILFFRAYGSSVMKLAIGAPSSPILSNILMYRFDQQISDLVARDGVVYTRYADDLTFSAPRTGYLVNVKSQIAQVIRHLPYPKLDINDEKTTYVTAKFRRSVTGLVLANDGRVTIGRDKKREIRAAVHAFTCSRLSDGKRKELAGMLAYVNAVEPEFLVSLSNKYGSGVIGSVKGGIPEGV